MPTSLLAVIYSEATDAFAQLSQLMVFVGFTSLTYPFPGTTMKRSFTREPTQLPLTWCLMMSQVVWQ